MRKLFLLVFSLLLLVYPVISFSQEIKPTMDYQSKLEELSRVLSQLQSFNQLLTEKLQILTQDSSVWETKYLEVEAQLTLWEKDYQELKAQFQALEQTYNNLGTDYQNLKLLLTTQQEEYQKLKESWEKLKKDLNNKLIFTGVVSGTGGLGLGALLTFLLILIF